MDIAAHTNEASDRLVRRLAGRLRFINWAWLILSIFLCVSAVGIIAGAWNIYVTARRWKLPQMISQKSPAAVSGYEGDAGWWITFLLINLALGGGIGALLIGYEFLFIRGPVLKNRHLFSGSH